MAARMNGSDTGEQWFCLRSKPQRQNFAAAFLRSVGIEVFNPQMRLRKTSKNGPVYRTEPLFPNYLFARFELMERFRRVRYATGISDILNFGGTWAVVPDQEIAELRGAWGEKEALMVPEAIQVGAPVKLSGGIFHGMDAVVVALLPARQRVRVLLEFLGGITETEVAAASILPSREHPLAL